VLKENSALSPGDISRRYERLPRLIFIAAVDCEQTFAA
jgi:hypothetical protein